MRRHFAVDSGPLVALFDPSDQAHQQAMDFFADRTVRGFVTTGVITEVTHLLDFRADLPVNFLRWLKRGAFAVEEAAADMDRIIELMTKYADVPMDFADATLVAACERLGTCDIVTLDADFLIYRPHGRKYFRNHFPE